MDALSPAHKSVLATVISVFKSGDIGPLKTALADGFIYKGSGLTLDKAQFIEKWSAIFEAGPRQRVEISSATESGPSVDTVLTIYGSATAAEEPNSLIVEDGKASFKFSGDQVVEWEDFYSIPL